MREHDLDILQSIVVKRGGFGHRDRHLLDAHYSRALRSSPGARAGWTAPDLRELPSAA
jgi:hypothetical protein